MGNLILESLEVRGFRGFRHLQIEHLGRVNLIVGKNNVGKSSLLEALRLYARRGSLALIWELLGERDESAPFSSRPTFPEVEERLDSLRYLFFGRRDVRDFSKSIHIGPINSQDKKLSITMSLLVGNDSDEGPGPRLSTSIGNQSIASYSIGSPTERLFLLEPKGSIDCVFIAANGLTRGQVGELWDGISLTDLEKDVLDALRIIAPGVERLSLVGDPAQRRTPIVKIKDINQPIPLRSLGDGMQRTLGIALALVNAKDGFLLIDEFENGLYYSVQPNLWRLIFEVARRLNVQVFATTHSWDCIEGFQKAASADKQTEGILIRLESIKGDIVSALFDERQQGIATREQIEVR
jgi:hypothetical protein